ncbi:universal stress protein [Streptomyces oryzae]|nr:universal stress protein [Streptomyces oryzae]
MAHVVTAGVDGTPQSAAAARWAAREAVARNASLRLVHVQVAESALDQMVVPDEDDATRQRAEQLVQAAAVELAARFPGLSLDTRTTVGEPAWVLTELSRTSDVVVIGSRGLSSLGGFLVGSVALPTVAHVQCPVVLVRTDTDSPSRDEALATGPGDQADTSRRIVAGVDVRHPCDELFAFAFEAAQRRSVPLEIRHGWEPRPYYGARPMPLAGLALEDLLDERADALAKMMQPWCEKFPGVEVDARAVLEQPASLLLRAAENGSLLVVGRRHRPSRFGAHVGPVAHAVMHHSRAPVAVVPHT